MASTLEKPPLYRNFSVPLISKYTGARDGRFVCAANWGTILSVLPATLTGSQPIAKSDMAKRPNTSRFIE